MPRAEEYCQAYMKPGVNGEEEIEKYMSDCGCDYQYPTQCTDLDIKSVGGKLICEASEDCKKGIQDIGDMWNEAAIKPRSNYRDCLAAFQTIKKLNYLCINQ